MPGQAFGIHIADETYHVVLAIQGCYIAGCVAFLDSEVTVFSSTEKTSRIIASGGYIACSVGVDNCGSGSLSYKTSVEVTLAGDVAGSVSVGNYCGRVGISEKTSGIVSERIYSHVSGTVREHAAFDLCISKYAGSRMVTDKRA